MGSKSSAVTSTPMAAARGVMANGVHVVQHPHLCMVSSGAACAFVHMHTLHVYTCSMRAVRHAMPG